METQTKTRTTEDQLFAYYQQDLKRMNMFNYRTYEQWIEDWKTNPHKMKALQRKWYERSR